MSEPKFDLAIIKRDVVDVVADKISVLIGKKELLLPADYSPENALKAAWLTLQETTDKDKNPVLKVCTPNSISMALFDMVVMGLNPMKKQCYFIAYGKTLSCQPSYFGAMATAQRVNPKVADFAAEVVYHGDTLTYKIVNGKRTIIDHEQALENVSNDRIVAAYCIALDVNGEPIRTEIMTMDEIKQAWRQSKQNPVNTDGSLKENSVHAKFTRDMAMKTVVNKLCKPIINASSDSYLSDAINRSGGVSAEEELAHEVAENANQEIIDIEAEVVPSEEPQTGEAGTVHNPAVHEEELPY